MKYKKRFIKIITLLGTILKYSSKITFFILILKIQHKKKDNIYKKIGIILKNACEKSGYLFLKFGQLLTTRDDIIHEDIINELKELQNKVQPLKKKIILNILKKNNIIKNSFKAFKEKPIAAGSIAQIHKAILKNGKIVVLKILRPNIKNDTKVLFSILLFLSKLLFFQKKIKIKYVLLLLQLRKNFLLELNFKKEIKNMEKIRKNLKYENAIKIPKVYYKLSTKNFITMEYVKGIPIDNITKLKKKKLNTEKIAEKFTNLFFKQIFQDNFFHADLHPGNVLIKKINNNKFIFILIDFGIISYMKKKDQYYIIKNFLAFTCKDYKKIAELHITSGWIPNISVINLEKDIKKIFNKILYLPLKKVLFKETLKNLLALAKKHKMIYQPQLFMFQKTLVNIESITRKLYPNFDILQTIKPIIQHSTIKIIIKKIFSN